MSSAKPKVLILGKLPPPYYGPAIATEILLQSSLRRHYTLHHLNTGVHESLLTLGQWSWRRSFKNLVLYFRFVRLLLRHWPDLVLIPISQSTTAFMKDAIFILLSRLFGRPTLLQLRGSNFKNLLAGMWPLTRGYVAWILRRTQGMIVLGNKLRHLFAEYFAADRIFVVPNGADYDFAPVKSANDIPRLLHLANLQASKGIADVVEAMRILQKDFSARCQLEVVGTWREDETKEHCLQLARAHALPITFHPSANANVKSEFLGNADLFIFTPRAPEGHPWVIVEAMAAGLPIISTDQGAITESVLNGVNGFIVATQSPEQIAEKAMLLLKYPELRKQMGLASRRLYLENFTEEKMIEKLRLCFDTVINSKHITRSTK